VVDIGNFIVDGLISTMSASYPSADVSSVYVNVPSSFPHISITEADNYSVELDTGDNEKFARIVYEVNVYSIADAPLTEAKGIMKVISDYMYRKNFTRTSCRQLPNADNNVFRYYARFDAVSDGSNIYRR